MATSLLVRGLRARPAAAAALLGLFLLASGCGGVGKCHPVSGKVSIDGKAVKGKGGTVLLKPDASKGNKSTFDALGTIDPEGSYTVATRGKAGAPPGWYKVVVNVVEPNSGEAFDTPLLLVRPDYLSPQKTPLAFEVVASPGEGAYDLDLKSK